MITLSRQQRNLGANFQNKIIWPDLGPDEAAAQTPD